MNTNEDKPTETHDRIDIDPGILAGKPVIKGTRIPVSMILNLVAHGITFDEIVEDNPELTKEDIRAAILYAESRLEH